MNILGPFGSLIQTVINKVGGIERARQISQEIDDERNAHVAIWATENLASQIVCSREQRTRLTLAVLNHFQAGGKSADVAPEVGAVLGIGLDNAQVIAITLGTRFSGYDAWYSCKKAGFKKKEWLSNIGGVCGSRHASLDGKSIGLDKHFRLKSGARALFPGDFDIAAENENCGCALIPHF